MIRGARRAGLRVAGVLVAVAAIVAAADGAAWWPALVVGAFLVAVATVLLILGDL